MGAQGRDAIRAALSEELAGRGVTDVTPEELDILTRTVTSPRRAAVGNFRRQLSALAGALNLVGELVRVRQPRWTETPRHVSSVVSLRPDQEEVTVVLAAR